MNKPPYIQCFVKKAFSKPTWSNPKSPRRLMQRAACSDSNSEKPKPFPEQ